MGLTGGGGVNDGVVESARIGPQVCPPAPGFHCPRKTLRGDEIAPSTSNRTVRIQQSQHNKFLICKEEGTGFL